MSSLKLVTNKMTGSIPQIKIEDNEYLWDGNKWIDLKNFIVPPEAIIEKLNKEIEEVD